jgi:cobalt/nickel transport system ATP-binding protein
MQPEAMLLDEPTNNLDKAIRERLIEILNKLNIAYMIISHDWDFLSETCTSLYIMDQGRVQQSDTDRLHLHRHAHTCGSQPHNHHMQICTPPEQRNNKINAQ